MRNKNFILVEYNGVPYPDGYAASLKEVAGHFDKCEIETTEKYSLHTEYSYGKRKFDSNIISKFEELKTSNKDGVPQLWKSNKWAEEFAEFIIALTANNPAPTVIEIHPPFNDYCDIDLFLERYRIFEKRIHESYPDVIIVIENRAGAIYKGGRFIIGKAKEIAELCQKISANNINLGVVLDFPQLLTAENIDSIKFKKEKYLSAIDTLANYKSYIKGIHIWGKKKSASGRWVAHAGNFDTYFGDNSENKTVFINGIMSICNDEIQRFFVPEVNTGAEDLSCIINDIFN